MSEFCKTPSYLFQKTPNSIFYFRIAIPKDIQVSLQGKELRLSLRTGLQSEAKRLSSRLSNECLNLFQEFRNYANMDDQAPQQLTIEIIKKILRQKRKDFLKENDYQRAISNSKTIEEVDALNNRLETLKASMKESIRTNLHDGMSLGADGILEKLNIEVDRSSDNYKLLCRELLRLSVNLVENAIERNNCDYTNSPGLLEEALEEKGIETEKIEDAKEVSEDSQPVLLTQVIQEYVDEQRHTVTEKSLVEYKSALNLFVEIVADIPADQLNHSELRNYKSILQKLPPNKNKIRKYRDLTIEQIVDLKLKKTLSIQTVNNNITKVSQLLDWAKRHGYVPENYAQG